MSKRAAGKTKASAARSRAAKKGWKARRAREAKERRAQESARRSDASKKGWETRRQRESGRAFWSQWQEDATNLSPNIMVDASGLAQAYGAAPAPNRRLGVQLLAVYAADGAAQTALARSLISGKWDAMMEKWQRTGMLPPEAGRLMAAGVRFETRRLNRTSVELTRAIFSTDFVEVMGVRANPIDDDSLARNAVYLKKGKTILEAKRKRFKRAESVSNQRKN